MNFKQLEDDTTSIREQGRVFPFCSSGTPADDNCYRKCDPDAGCQERIQNSSAFCGEKLDQNRAKNVFLSKNGHFEQKNLSKKSTNF